MKSPTGEKSIKYCIVLYCIVLQPGETDKLFLEKSWHRAAAILLVEVSAVKLPNSPGGVAHEAFKDDASLLQQASNE